jgi:hypothetical protein
MGTRNDGEDCVSVCLLQMEVSKMRPDYETSSASREQSLGHCLLLTFKLEGAIEEQCKIMSISG